MKNIKIKLRKASSKDAEFLANLGAKTFYETYQDKVNNSNLLPYIKNSFNRNNLKKEIIDSSNTFLIAFVDRKAVGYAKLRRNSFPNQPKKLKSIEIERMYVSKQMVGKGIGSILMEECVRIANNEKTNFIWLGVWKKNIKAVSFYKKFGFSVFGSHEFKLGREKHKDLLMRLRIS